MMSSSYIGTVSTALQACSLTDDKQIALTFADSVVQTYSEKLLKKFPRYNNSRYSVIKIEKPIFDLLVAVFIDKKSSSEVKSQLCNASIESKLIEALTFLFMLDDRNYEEEAHLPIFACLQIAQDPDLPAYMPNLVTMARSRLDAYNQGVMKCLRDGGANITARQDLLPYCVGPKAHLFAYYEFEMRLLSDWDIDYKLVFSPRKSSSKALEYSQVRYSLDEESAYELESSLRKDLETIDPTNPLPQRLIDAQELTKKISRELQHIQAYCLPIIQRWETASVGEKTNVMRSIISFNNLEFRIPQGLERSVYKDPSKGPETERCHSFKVEPNNIEIRDLTEDKIEGIITIGSPGEYYSRRFPFCMKTKDFIIITAKRNFDEPNLNRASTNTMIKDALFGVYRGEGGAM